MLCNCNLVSLVEQKLLVMIKLQWNLHLQPPLYKGYFPLSPRGPLWRDSPVLMSSKHYIFNTYLTGPLIPDPSLLFQSMV